MTDNELLLAITRIMDKKIEPLEKKIDKLDIKIDNVHHELKNDITLINSKIDNVHHELKNDITLINSKIENSIETKINLLAENYLPSANRFESTSDKLDIMLSDIEVLKKVIIEHSEKLSKIS